MSNWLKIASIFQQQSRIDRQQEHIANVSIIASSVGDIIVKIPKTTYQQPHITLEKSANTNQVIAGLQNSTIRGFIPSNPQYSIPNVSGGTSPIYNFLAPPEQQVGQLAVSAAEKRQLLIYYFQNLYPLTPSNKWEKMTDTQLISYYYNLDFWYTFNPSWTVSPTPVTLDPTVVPKWTKNTFYQAGTVVQSAITSLCWDYDNLNKKYYYAARLNNAPQVDPSLTYTNKQKQTITVRNVCRNKDFWDSISGKKIEITSWGWNPYPFGIYAQGPFKGTGNFMQLPDKLMIGTSHWDIIQQCKNPSVTDEELWSNIVKHELSRIVNTPIAMENAEGKYVSCTPWIIKKKGNRYYWDTLLPNGSGITPILVSYHCFIMGGFGGIGDKWMGNYGPFWQSWTYGSTAHPEWRPGYYYALLVEEDIDSSGKPGYVCPLDQSIPNGVPGFENGRPSQDMWKCFGHMFNDFIAKWDSNYAVEMWRYPLFRSGTNQFYNTGPCVYNACDDLMMAMATGNFDIVHYSPWGISLLDPNLSKFSQNPMKWDKILNPDGSLRTSGDGFPTGKITTIGSGYTFIVRSQMPNVNGDICLELADFRMLTPGLLGNGAGDQELWSQMFTDYCDQYIYTVDPFDDTNYNSFSDEYAPWLPETKPIRVAPDNTWWKHDENPLTGKSFYDFDVYSGQWVGWLSYTGKRNGAVIAFDNYPAHADAGGLIQLENTVYDANGRVISVDKTCNVPNPINNIEPSVESINGPMVPLLCYENKDYYCYNYWDHCRNFTFARKDDYYYPFAPDSFTTGIVGFQGNGYSANIGACQTRWWICSKGISWNFNAPLANRLIAKNGIRMKQYAHSLGTCELPPVLKGILIGIMVLAGIVIGFLIFARPPKYGIYIGICTLLILVLLLWILYYRSGKTQIEKNKLNVYFALVYPAVNPYRWTNMSYDDLVKFYCTLHQWYRGDGLPSPVDFLISPHWQGQPPLNMNSSWKNFTTRKSCINGAGRALNQYDNNIVIGYDKFVNTTDTETPSGILFRGRQIQTCGNGANFQHVSFFSPSVNMWVDTFDASSSVNDPDVAQWENAQYIEVSSQWGPFPDGAYFDWAQGTGVWLKLGKHKVGLNGQDLLRRLGEEVVQNINKNLDGLKDVYFQQWQRTGLDGMTVDKNGNITIPGICTVCGLYGTVIMTLGQISQIQDSISGQTWVNESSTFSTADGWLYSRILNYVKISYYDVDKKQWVNTMPQGQGHIQNYPFPLPFGNGRYMGDGQGRPIMNEFALRMPWKYQQFNATSMYRNMVIDALFLNTDSISYNELLSKGADYNYVDWLKSNVTFPLKNTKTWEQAVDAVYTLLMKPVVHPIFSQYPRTMKKTTNGMEKSLSDGPWLILSEPNEWKNGIPSLHRIQTGSLDKTVYLQDTAQSKGIVFNAPMDVPQLQGADLEIDHWQSAIGKLLDYDSLVRIQHWCGNKSMSYDIEVIHLRIIIPGNLITNRLDANIYEIWKSAFANSWFSLRDPFYPSNHVYQDTYKNVYNEKDISSTSLNATWVGPPWIGYNELTNLYGWEPEGLDTFANTQRLAYAPIGAEEIGFSNSYPEYNKYIMNHFMRQLI